MARREARLDKGEMCEGVGAMRVILCGAKESRTKDGCTYVYVIYCNKYRRCDDVSWVHTCRELWCLEKLLESALGLVDDIPEVVNDVGFRGAVAIEGGDENAGAEDLEKTRGSDGEDGPVGDVTED